MDNGDGTYTVDWGTEVTFVAVPAEDYHLLSWSNGAEVTEDNKQTLTSTDQLSLSAFFKHDTYILTVEGAEVEVALFDDVMAVVDTCECLTDIQWYWRANSTDQWKAIEGATGYYYKQAGGLSGEYFIHAKMNGIDTYTCPQEDLSLYADGKRAKVTAYPNPVQSTTTVTIENSYRFEHDMRIVNLMGNEVLNTTFEGNTTTQGGKIGNLAKVGASVIGDLGCRVALNDNWGMYFGLYVGYGLTNMLAQAKTDPLVMINAKQQIEYSGTFASCETAKVNLLRCGLKIAIDLGWPAENAKRLEAERLAVLVHRCQVLLALCHLRRRNAETGASCQLVCARFFRTRVILDRCAHPGSEANVCRRFVRIDRDDKFCFHCIGSI